RATHPVILEETQRRGHCLWPAACTLCGALHTRQKIMGGGIGRKALAGGSSGGCYIVPVPLPQLERTFVYPNTTAKRPEHRSTKLAVVRARNPLETMSRLRMIHLPLRCSSELIKGFGIPGQNYQAI